MSVVDSSGWIEFLLGSEAGQSFRPAVQGPNLVVPTIVIVEVRRWWLSSRTPAGDLADITDLMSRSQVVPLSREIAETASVLGMRHRLPLADSIIYATAQSLGLEVWTQDKDFDGLPAVQYFPKRPG